MAQKLIKNVNKDYRKRYEKLSQSDAFKKVYRNKSISCEEHVSDDFVDREWQTECVIEILKFLDIEITHANICDVGDILQKYVEQYITEN